MELTNFHKYFKILYEISRKVPASVRAFLGTIFSEHCIRRTAGLVSEFQRENSNHKTEDEMRAGAKKSCQRQDSGESQNCGIIYKYAESPLHYSGESDRKKQKN